MLIRDVMWEGRDIKWINSSIFSLFLIIKKVKYYLGEFY